MRSSRCQFLVITTSHSTSCRFVLLSVVYWCIPCVHITSPKVSFFRVACFPAAGFSVVCLHVAFFRFVSFAGHPFLLHSFALHSSAFSSYTLQAVPYFCSLGAIARHASYLHSIALQPFLYLSCIIFCRIPGAVWTLSPTSSVGNPSFWVLLALSSTSWMVVDVLTNAWGWSIQ